MDIFGGCSFNGESTYLELIMQMIQATATQKGNLSSLKDGQQQQVIILMDI